MTWTIAQYDGGELSHRTIVTATELSESWDALILQGWREQLTPWNDTRVLRNDAGIKLIATVTF